MEIASESPVTFTASAKSAFLQYLRENPTNRRITQTDRNVLVGWLTNPYKRPSSQREFSRRNYVFKTFCWDEKTQSLFTVAKTRGGKHRTVVTEEKIADVVEFVHEGNNHGGWDATWNDISSSYYGILRSDVIHLLKQCQICALNPTKKPKGSVMRLPCSQTIEQDHLDFLDPTVLQCGGSAWSVQRAGETCQDE